MPSPFFNFPSPPPGEQQTVPFPRRRGGVAAAPVYAQLKAEKEQLKADKGQVRNKQHDPNSGKKDASKSTTIDDPGASQPPQRKTKSSTRATSASASRRPRDPSVKKTKAAKKSSATTVPRASPEVIVIGTPSSSSRAPSRSRSTTNSTLSTGTPSTSGQRPDNLPCEASPLVPTGVSPQPFQRDKILPSPSHGYDTNGHSLSGARGEFFEGTSKSSQSGGSPVPGSSQHGPPIGGTAQCPSSQPTDSTAADPNVLFQQILDGMASGDPGIADLDLASLFPSPEDWQSVVGTSVDTTPASSSTPASHPRAISTAPPAKDAASTSSATPAPGAVPAVDATPSVPTPTPNIVARPYATPGSFPVDDAVPLTSTPPSLTAAPAPQSTMMALPLPRPQRTLSEYIFPSFSQAMQSFNFTGTDGPQAQRTLMGPGVPPAGVNHTQRTMPPTGPPRKMTPVYNYPMFNSTKIWRPYGEPGPDPDPDPEPIRLGKRKQEATQSSVELPSFRTLGPDPWADATAHSAMRARAPQSRPRLPEATVRISGQQPRARSSSASLQGAGSMPNNGHVPFAQDGSIFEPEGRKRARYSGPSGNM